MLPIIDNPFRCFWNAEKVKTESEYEFRVQVFDDGVGDLMDVDGLKQAGHGGQRFRTAHGGAGAEDLSAAARLPSDR